MPAPSRDPRRARRTRRLTAVAAAAALAVGVPAWSTLTADARPQSSSAAPAAVSPPGGSARDDRGVLANLWEWNWRSVAKECRTHLGPDGYAGVQVAPPQDSVKRTKLGDGQDSILHPWWEVYQAVDYGLTSRMGNEAQFRRMVSTCRRAGVKVYVDAVINHMTGQGDTSYGGVSFERYSLPGALLPDGTSTSTPGTVPSATGGIDDFNNRAGLQLRAGRASPTCARTPVWCGTGWRRTSTS